MGKKFFATLVALAVMNLSLFGAVPLKKGTVLNVRVMTEINSNKASNGTEVVVVDDDVVKDGTVVIAKGTPVKVSINKKKAKGVGKAGSVELRCISTTSVDGQTIALEGIKLKKAIQDKVSLLV